MVRYVTESLVRWEQAQKEPLKMVSELRTEAVMPRLRRVHPL